MARKPQGPPPVEASLARGAPPNESWRRFVRLMLAPLPAEAEEERSQNGKAS